MPTHWFRVFGVFRGSIIPNIPFCFLCVAVKYPSTFIISQAGKVLFAHISHKHGDRVSAEKVLAALAPLP